MSFKDYIKEQEDLIVLDQEKTKKQKIADLIRTMEDINDEKFHDFAVNELGMEEAEAEALVYKMLRDFLLTNDNDEDGIPDDLEIGDEFATDDMDTDIVPVDDDEDYSNMPDVAKNFINASEDLLEQWQELGLDDVNGYPKYLPSFDELVYDMRDFLDGVLKG